MKRWGLVVTLLYVLIILLLLVPATLLLVARPAPAFSITRSFIKSGRRGSSPLFL